MLANRLRTARALTGRSLTLGLLLITSGCGGTTSNTTVIGPSSGRCAVSASLTTRSIPAGGGTATLAVVSARDCEWSALTDAAWVALNPAGGRGDAAIQVNVASNPQFAARTARVVVNDTGFDLIQAAAPAPPPPPPPDSPPTPPGPTPPPAPPLPGCTAEIDSERQSFDERGGSGRVRVQSEARCGWSGSSNASWIAIVSAAPGSGNGEVHYQVERNSSTQARSGIITVAGRTHVVEQSGGARPAPACSYEVDPQERSFGPGGGTSEVRVRADAACSWTASSHASWIAIVSGGGSSGNGDVQYRVEPNSGTQARSGTITVAGRTHRVEQSGAPEPTPTCSYQADPQERSFAADGGRSEVRVRTAPGCSWSASSNASWIAVLSGAAGSGDGEVEYRVDRNNSTQARSGTITFAGRTHRVEQSGAPEPTPTCSYQLDPQDRSFGAEGGVADLRVRTDGACGWSASTNASWIVMLSGAGGSGIGEVQYGVERNGSTQARSGTITVAGRTHRVEQSGAAEPAPTCSYQVDPQDRSFGPDGGTSDLRIRTDGACGWTASSNASWVVILSGAGGSGNGEVRYRVERNGSGHARSGAITVAGRTHRIEQSGAPEPTPTCSYQVDPQDRSFGADGGASDLRVRADGGCGWAASSNASWIVIVSGGGGSGNGEVRYRVERNSRSEARSGAITVAGRTHRVEQRGAAAAPSCSYQVNPPERSFGPNGGSSEIRVRTQSGCRWSATSNASWIVMTSTREGTGDGAIEYRVDPNTGSAARTGSVSIGGHTVRITQNAR